jgi:hypothetical protein
MQLVAAHCIYSNKAGGAVMPSWPAAPGKVPKIAPPTFLTLSHAVAKKDFEN